MTTVEIKRLLGRMLHYLLHSSSRRVILIYHAIGTGPWAITEQVFHAQMEWLKAHAEVVPLNTLLSSSGRTGLQVSLTFDDGYRCLHTIAAPALRSLAFPVTVYLNTGLISDKGYIPSDPSLGHYPGEEFMHWKDVEDLASSGWTIGSHGIDHIDLTKADTETVKRQARDSKADIEARLGIGCNHFSYPWGLFNSNVQYSLRAAGFDFAVTCVHGPVSISSDPLALPRLDIKKEYNLDDFIAVVKGDWDFLWCLHQMK